MSDDFGRTLITLVDDDGQESELEYVDTMDYNGSTYAALLPVDMDENDPDYGYVILRVIPGDDGIDMFEDIESEEELEDVFEHFSVFLFEDEE